MIKITQPNEEDVILPESYASNIDQLSKYLRYANKLKGVDAEELTHVFSTYQAYEIGYKAGKELRKRGEEYDKQYPMSLIQAYDTETNKTYDLTMVKDAADLMQAIKFGKSFDDVNILYISEAIKGFSKGYTADEEAIAKKYQEETGQNRNSNFRMSKKKSFGYGVLVGLLIAVAVFVTICAVAYAIGYFNAAGAINGAVDSLNITASKIATIAFA